VLGQTATGPILLIWSFASAKDRFILSAVNKNFARTVTVLPFFFWVFDLYDCIDTYYDKRRQISSVALTEMLSYDSYMTNCQECGAVCGLSFRDDTAEDGVREIGQCGVVDAITGDQVVKACRCCRQKKLARARAAEVKTAKAAREFIVSMFKSDNKLK